MSLVLILLLFGDLALLLLGTDWRTALTATIAVGFVQDPLRKITSNQPGLMVGLVLVFFLLSAALCYRRRGSLMMPQIFQGQRQLTTLVPFFFVLIGLQAVQSFLRFGSPTLTMIGIGFYLAPFLGLWMGYQVGLEPKSLRKLLGVYLLLSIPWSFSVWLSHQGMDWGLLLKEVGGGILINFEGFSKQGASGFWRTSEVAAWHLAAAACLLLVFGWSGPQRSTFNIYGLGSIVCSFLTLLTGRRKSIVLVVTFVLVMLVLFSLSGNIRQRDRLITGILGPLGLSVIAIIILSPDLLLDINPYLWRTSTAWGEIIPRFHLLGINTLLPALFLTGGIGFGAGAAAQAGDIQFNQVEALQGVRASTFGYVAEGGLSKLILELGLPGIILIGLIVYHFFLLIRRNLSLLTMFDSATSNLYWGLFGFAIANIPFFMGASQIYGDPFVLLLLGICAGSCLSIPSIVKRHSSQESLILPVNSLASAEVFTE